MEVSELRQGQSATCSRFPRFRLLCWSWTGVVQDVTASLILSEMDINCNKQWNKLNSRIIIHLWLLSQPHRGDSAHRAKLQKQLHLCLMRFVLVKAVDGRLRFPTGYHVTALVFTIARTARVNQIIKSRSLFEPGFSSSFRLALIHLHIAHAAFLYCVTEQIDFSLVLPYMEFSVKDCQPPKGPKVKPTVHAHGHTHTFCFLSARQNHPDPRWRD